MVHGSSFYRGNVREMRRVAGQRCFNGSVEANPSNVAANRDNAPGGRGYTSHSNDGEFAAISPEHIPTPPTCGNHADTRETLSTRQAKGRINGQAAPATF